MIQLVVEAQMLVPNPNLSVVGAAHIVELLTISLFLICLTLVPRQSHIYLRMLF